MNQQPLISVIVPIYNVAPYLRRCLNSLKRQTLKQIEVICIDDGSTDGSGDIAEEYTTTEWPRFRCIHTENHGLSAARNLGIDEAEADWIMLVDSDDWVDKDYCRIPYELAHNYEADMVIFAFSYSNWKNNEPKQRMATGVIDFSTAMKYGGNAAWRRLYKRTLFDGVRYPENRVFEDIATTYKTVHNARKIVCVDIDLYHYTTRKKSISHVHNESHERDRLAFAIERHEALVSYGCRDIVFDRYLQLFALKFLTCVPKSDDALYRQAEDIVSSIKGFPANMNYKQKFALLTWRMSRRAFDLLCLIYGRLNQY